MTPLNQITSNLTSTIKIFAKSKRQIFLILLLQFAFLAILAWSSIEILPRIPEAALQMGDVLTQQSQSLQPEDAYKLEEMLGQNEQFMQALQQTVKALLTLVAIIAASWIILIMPCWYLAHTSVKKTPIKVLFRLFGLGIFWSIVLGVIFVIYSIASGSTQTLLPLSSSGMTTTIMIVVLAVVVYVSHVTFAAADQKFKKMFSICITHAKTTVPAVLINTLLIFVAGSFGVLWWFDNPTVSLVLLICLLFPVCAFTRMHLIQACQEPPTRAKEKN